MQPRGAPLDGAVVEDYVQRPAQHAEGEADEPGRLHLVWQQSERQQPAVMPTVAKKFVEASHLEEGEVVTRFPFERTRAPALNPTPQTLHLPVRRLPRVLPHQHRLVAQLQLVQQVAHLPGVRVSRFRVED